MLFFEPCPIASIVMTEATPITVSYTHLPVPAFSSALNYFYSLTSADLPANLVQAQRDYFGAHTFERKDELRGQFFHENWTGHGGDTKSGTYNV